MYRLTTDELGEHGGRRYYLTVAVEPCPSEIDGFDPYTDAEEWTVSIHYPGTLPNESDTEIARIDTSHGRPHFDELFVPHRPKEWLPEGFGLREAERRLTTAWRLYAEQYSRHHDVSSEE